MGYTASRTRLNDVVRPWRPPWLPKPLRQKRNRRALDPRQLLTSSPERLGAGERAVVQRLLAAGATVAAGYALVQRFRQLLNDRDAAASAVWLADARARTLPGLVAVANGMLADCAAVVAAVTETWSTGMVEGHVNKVELRKRLGCSRAGFPLRRPASTKGPDRPLLCRLPVSRVRTSVRRNVTLIADTADAAPRECDGRTGATV